MNVASLSQQYLVRSILHFANDRRLKIYPGVIGCTLLVMLVVFFAFNRAWMLDLEKMPGADFIAFYTGARFLIDGMADSFYDFAAQAEFQRMLIDQAGFAAEQFNDSFTPFINPPYAALLYWPFGLEDYLVGYTIWMVTNIACFIFALYTIKLNWFTESKLTLPVLVISGLSFLPTFIWITYGQATGILFLLLTQSLIMLRNDREFRGGFVLGLCAFKPQLGVCLAVSLMLNLRWRALFGGLIGVSIWLALGLTFFSVQMQEYWELKSRLLSILTAPEFKTWGIHSLYGFSHLLLGSFSSEVADYLWIALSIGMLTVLAHFWRQIPWQLKSKHCDRGLAGAFAISMLLGVQLYSYDLTLLIIPFMLMAASFPAGPNDRRLDNDNILLWTIIVYFICALGPYITRLQLTLTSTNSFEGIGLQLSTISIAVWGIYVLKSAIQVQPSDQAKSGN